MGRMAEGGRRTCSSGHERLLEELAGYAVRGSDDARRGSRWHAGASAVAFEERQF
jgi:hypothetical protein